MQNLFDEKINFSSEQQQIINATKTSNIKIIARAGCGKTTTAVGIVSDNPRRKFLIITYNRTLADDTRNKIRHHGLDNVEAHTYHSHCSKYYNPTCDDVEMQKALSYKLRVPNTIEYDCIIIDEIQDMTDLYCQYISRILRHNLVSDPLMIVIGDPKQNVYGSLKNSNSDYLINADKYFKPNSAPWITLNLTQSFRLTQQMCSFINELCDEKLIVSTKNGAKPQCYITNLFDNDCIMNIIKIIQDFILHGIKPSEILITAPSIRAKSNDCKSPLQRLVDQLTFANIRTFIPTSDDFTMPNDREDMVNFASFHQTKGREFRVVFAYGFDYAYCKYYNTTDSDLKCSNPMYVALTRSKEHLILLQNQTTGSLKFATKNVYACCDVIGKNMCESSDRTSTKYTRSIQSVCEFRRYTNYNIKDNIVHGGWPATEYLTTKLPQKSQDGTWIADITGTALPIWFALQNNNFTQYLTFYKTVLHETMDKYKSTASNYYQKLQTFEAELNDMKTITLKDTLKISHFITTCESGYINRFNDIIDYNWISDADAKILYYRFQCNIDNNNGLLVEFPIHSDTDYTRSHLFALTGRCDAYDPIDNTIYEFKCVDKLLSDHILQLAIYAWMIENYENTIKISSTTRVLKKCRYILYNILSGETCEFYYNDRIDKVVKQIFLKKTELQNDTPNISPTQNKFANTTSCRIDQPYNTASSSASTSSVTTSCANTQRPTLYNRVAFRKLCETAANNNTSEEHKLINTLLTPDLMIEFKGSDAVARLLSCGYKRSEVIARFVWGRLAPYKKNELTIYLRTLYPQYNIVVEKRTNPQNTVNKVKTSPLTSSAMIKGKNILVFDTETTGISTKNDRVIQIAWSFIENFNVKNIDYKNIKTMLCFPPDLTRMPREAEAVHHISYEQCKTKGVAFAEIMKIMFPDLRKIDMVIAHNCSFDSNIMVAELQRYNLPDYVTYFQKKSYCTMSGATKLCGLTNMLGRGKPPTLSELHKFCCGVPPQAAHTADVDVYSLLKILGSGKF